MREREHEAHHPSAAQRDVMYPYPVSPRGSGPPATAAQTDWSMRNVMSNGYYPTTGPLTSPVTQGGPQSSEDKQYWNHMFRELGLTIDALDTNTTGPVLGAGYSMSSSIGTAAGPVSMTMNLGQTSMMGPSSSTSSPNSGYGGGHLGARGPTSYGVHQQYQAYHSMGDGPYGL